MGEDYLSLDVGEQGDILRTVAAESGRAAVILEKDIWLCWVLHILFSIPDHHPMAFKGGTSLSKVYGVIDRFSEDVDSAGCDLTTKPCAMGECWVTGRWNSTSWWNESACWRPKLMVGADHDQCC